MTRLILRQTLVAVDGCSSSQSSISILDCTGISEETTCEDQTFGQPERAISVETTRLPADRMPRESRSSVPRSESAPAPGGSTRAQPGWCRGTMSEVHLQASFWQLEPTTRRAQPTAQQLSERPRQAGTAENPPNSPISDSQSDLCFQSLGIPPPPLRRTRNSKCPVGLTADLHARATSTGFGGALRGLSKAHQVAQIETLPRSRQLS